jgi:hypothetical protein
MDDLLWYELHKLVHKKFPLDSRKRLRINHSCLLDCLGSDEICQRNILLGHCDSGNGVIVSRNFYLGVDLDRKA